MTAQHRIPLLELRKISKSFASNGVLQDIDFLIYPGEIVALLGDNGAGKSTLVKLINGVHQPSKGQILWEGNSIHFHSQNGPQEARRLGIETVYQDLGLVNTLSITRNFFLGREQNSNFLGMPFLSMKKMTQTARSALKEIGISRPLDPDSPVASLSGGERQAIAINRARHFGAKLMILDEPTSALSLRQTQQVLSYITDSAKAGLGIIFITHTLAHIEGIVDRIVVLFQGRKVGDYLPREINQTQVGSLITHGRFLTV